ncbi:MAG: nucleotide exchange factor GrpE [Acidobacteriota bacterium]|nr:nucleotide exchange factor GrpE [Acidobacteriota bacterium]MDQ3421527.1 nucleotide exchange factor GrpE [Acidobacteriota bacterium]
MTDENIKVVDRRWWAQDPGEQREDTRGSGKPTYLEDLEKQLAEKDKQIAEYLAKYRGAAAEFEEARLRLRREISKDTERSRREILAELLDVVDNLDRAMESARAGGSLESLVEGVEMVRRQFLAKLEGFGVTRIDVEQQRFDPAVHEAISSVPAASPDQDGMVVGTVRSGYRIGGDVLRPAAVAVAKHGSHE